MEPRKPLGLFVELATQGGAETVERIDVYTPAREAPRTATSPSTSKVGADGGFLSSNTSSR